MIFKFNVKGLFWNLSWQKLFKITLFFIIFNTQIISIYPKAEQNLAFRNKEDCIKMNGLSNCIFAWHAGECDITCPRADHKSDDHLKFYSVQIRVPPRHTNLELKCLNTVDEMPNWPELNIGSTNLVKIYHCPLAKNVSISNILMKFNLNNVPKLFYFSGDFRFNFKRIFLKNLQSLIYLSLSLENAVTFESDLLADLSNLKIFKLYTYQQELSENFLTSLTKLKYVELALYNVTKLPTNIFRFNLKLETLSIVSSQITQLQEGTFPRLSLLETLIVNANDIKIIESNVFDELSNLTTISLNSNKIEELPKGLLTFTKKLRKFTLGNNRVPLRFLPARLLADLPALKTIVFNCQLEQIPEDIFANSTKIEEIDLEKNKLPNLPETLFFHQTNLIELDLSENVLSELPERLFIRNSKLVKLKLTSNRIKQITSKIFKPLTSLEELLMGNNLITTIDANAFVGLTKLRILKLHNNSINLNDTSINSPFHVIKSLEGLNLCNNSITNTFLDSNLVIPTLKELNLCFNSISKINLNKLQYISNRTLKIILSYNQLQTIVYKESQNILSTIQRQNNDIQLDLRGNPINCDCHLLGFIQFLKGEGTRNLHLRPTNLSCQQPSSLINKSLHKVLPEELNCQLENCPSGCKCFEFSFNQTISVECVNRNKTFMPELKSFLQTPTSYFMVKSFAVNLENNNINHLPNMSIAEFDKITALRLAGNKLNEIKLENIPRNLIHLDLRNNSFKILSNDVLEFFKRSNINKTLKLSGNPWQCDCSTQPLIEFVQKHFTTLSDRSEMHCTLPNNSIVAFQQLNFLEICTTNQTLIICLSVFTILIVSLIVATLICYVKFKIEIQVWLYSHKIFLWFVTEAELDKDKIFDAFISYSSKDEKFVAEHLVPNLENGNPSFKICVHYRNFLVGESIPTNIANAVENSRRTIILLSKNFLESDWALHEFRSSHLAALDEKKPRVIVILYGDIGNIDAIDSELQVYLKTKTYLSWDDPKFWDRLRFAMPHINAQSKNDLTLHSIQNGYAIVDGIVHS